MNRMNIFQALRSARFSALVALVGLGLLFTASGAKAAGCGIPSNKGTAPSIPFVSPHGDESSNHQEDEKSNKHAGIVGLWHLIYTANSASPPVAFPPTPFQFLESFKTWHADGTEFENAFLPPTGGNICFGVWKELDHGSVKLHHIGLMFDSMGRVSNIFTVDEKDTVASNGKPTAVPSISNSGLPASMPSASETPSRRSREQRPLPVSPLIDQLPTRKNACPRTVAEGIALSPSPTPYRFSTLTNRKRAPRLGLCEARAEGQSPVYAGEGHIEFDLLK